MTRDKRSTVTKIYFECLHIVWCWKVSPRAATSVLSSPLSQASQLLTFCSQTATFYDKIVIKRFRGGLQEILYNILDRSSLRNRTLEVLRNSSLISTYLLTLLQKFFILTPSKVYKNNTNFHTCRRYGCQGVTICRTDDGLPRVAVPGLPGRGGRAAVQELALHAAQGSIHRHPPTHPARRPQVTHLHLNISNIYSLMKCSLFVHLNIYSL